MADIVSVLKAEEEVVGFSINGQEFYDEDGMVEIEIEQLNGFNISSIPDGFWLHAFDEYGLEWDIAKDGDHVAVVGIRNHIYRKYWDHKFGVLQYVNTMRRAIDVRKKSNNDVDNEDTDDDGAHVFFRFSVFLLQDMPIDKAIKRVKEIITEIESHTERLLEGEELSSEILEKEPKFTLEVLLPLFRNMGFIDVKYNHGKREFGKDITFSEIDKFGVRRNFGVQIKVGDLSGEAGAEIDKIIGQVDDAFKMSYIDTTSREKRFVSDLIIAISGRFTDNAKDKIIQKINRQNIYFLDIDKIEELLSNYMKKKLR